MSAESVGRKRSESSARFHRQLGIVDPLKLEGLRVAIIGAGATGSMTALMLAKMGVGYIKIWDMDKVEQHNLPNQFHPESSRGMNKAESLAKVAVDFGALDVEFVPEEFKAGMELDVDIVIMAVDSMVARKDIYEKSIKNKYRVKQIIDPRIGGESYRVYTFRPTDPIAQLSYEKTLYLKTEDVPCTERSIIYNVGIVAGYVALSVKRYITEEEMPFEILGDIRNLMFFQNGVDPEEEPK